MSQRAETSNRQASRNAPCPCGSGKKFKHCCMRVQATASSRASLLAAGLAHQEASRHAEAQRIYAEMLRMDPHDADALHYSGVAAHHLGEVETAIAYMRKAIELAPGKTHYYLNLGRMLEGRKAWEDAIVLYRQAIERDQDSEEAHYRLGVSLEETGRFVEAARSFSQALRVNPDSYEATSGLGNVLRSMGRLQQAVVCFRRAISMKPSSLGAANNLGLVYQKLGLFSEAIACYREALTYHPRSAPLLSNLGSSLRSRSDWAEAIESCRQAIAMDPNFLPAHLNLANAYKDQGRFQEAVESYRDALAIAPQSALALTNLGASLIEQDKIPEAIESYRRAVGMDSVNTSAYSNLLYMYSFTCHVAPEIELEAARGWEHSLLTEDARVAARARASVQSGAFTAEPLEGRKLRLGIVSAELGAHAVAVFLLSFLRNLDRNRIHLTLFPTYAWTGPRAEEFYHLADSYISLVGVPAEAAAERIRAEKMDVLIDTTGHTSDCHLGIFAHRAAPVQCSYIGYWSTTGLTEMDWYITDANYSAGCDAHFSEKLWRLPHVAHCYQGDESLPASGWSPDPEGTIWLGSFNKYSKIRGETLALWEKVMKAMPEAKLLLEDRGDHEQETHERILNGLETHGVSRGRVKFLPQVPGRDYTQHMALYDRLDIALDTIPFNSGTTAFDALWMGVPLVALEGDRVCGRMASSIVKELGRPEWSAQTVEEYVSIVRTLAADLEGRRALRKTLRETMLRTELCDGRGLARALEDAFEAMYNQWLQGR